MLAITAFAVVCSLCSGASAFAPTTPRVAGTAAARMMADKSSAPAFETAAVLTFAGASRAMAAAEACAEANGWAVCIVVCDAGGEPMLMHRRTFTASAAVAAGKAKAATHFARPTSALEASVNAESGGRSALLSAPYVLMRGGVPIVVDGVCVGAVGVSGVLADQDERVAMAAVGALTA